MSLDVYLRMPPAEQHRVFASEDGGELVERIYVRHAGQTKEVTREEFAEMYPGLEPVALLGEPDGRQVYSANITHNMGRMAAQVGLYEPLWRPEEVGVKTADQLAPLLRTGLARLRDERERLQEFNPTNGWGNYDLLVRFTADYLEACERWPSAEVSVWR